MTVESPAQPKTDFVSCTICGATYPAYRSSVCPHPIPRNTPDLKLIAEHSVPVEKDVKGLPLAVGEPGVSVETGLAVIPKVKQKRNRIKNGNRPPLVLAKPFYLKQKDESPIWFGRFCVYRDLGPGRMISQVVKMWNLSGTAVYRQAKEDKWDVRVAVYDQEQEKERRAIAQKVQRKQLERDLALVAAGKSIVAAEYNRFLAIIEAGGTIGLDFDEMTAAYEKLAKLGRLLTGESTEHVVHETPEVEREHKLRDAVEIVQKAIDTLRAAGREEQYLANRRAEYAETVAQRLCLQPEEVLLAIMGAVQEENDSVS